MRMMFFLPSECRDLQGYRYRRIGSPNLVAVSWARVSCRRLLLWWLGSRPPNVDIRFFPEKEAAYVWGQSPALHDSHRQCSATPWEVFKDTILMM